VATSKSKTGQLKLSKRDIEGITRRSYVNYAQAQKAFVQASKDARTRANKYVAEQVKLNKQLERLQKKAAKDNARGFKSLQRATKQTTKNVKQIQSNVNELGKLVQQWKKLTSSSKLRETVSDRKSSTSQKTTRKQSSSTSIKKQTKSTTSTPSNTIVQSSATPFRKTKKHIQFREFNEIQQNQVMNAALSDMYNNAEDYDKLLGPNEVWGYKIFNRQSYKAFRSFKEMIDYMSSGQSGSNGNHLIASWIGEPRAYATQVGALQVNRIGSEQVPQTRSMLVYQFEGNQARKKRREAHEKRESKLRKAESEVKNLKRKLERSETRYEKVVKSNKESAKAVEKKGKELRSARKKRDAELERRLSK
jgi:hypothetical protein